MNIVHEAYQKAEYHHSHLSRELKPTGSLKTEIALVLEMMHRQDHEKDLNRCIGDHEVGM